MQRTTITIVVVALVLVSGCNALFGSDTTPAVTPADIPTDTPTRTPISVQQLAPGLTNSGITNMTALLVTHNATLRNTSFTVHKNRIDLYTNGSVTYNQTTTIRVAGENNGYYRSDTYSPDSTKSIRHSETWSNGELTLSRITYANNTTRYTEKFLYDRSRAAKVFYLWLLTAGESIHITPENSTITARFTRNDTQFYRVRSTDLDRDRSYIIWLLVDSRGVIHEYSIIEQDNKKQNASDAITIISGNYTGIGTTAPPERPSWYSEAREQTESNFRN